MIHVRYKELKGKYTIVAIADHQKDLNNLRLMSYSLYKKDKVVLNKDEYGGPYLKLDTSDFQNEEGHFDEEKIREFATNLENEYN